MPMNLENGLPKYRFALSAKFVRAIKVFKKSYKSKREAIAFTECISNIVEGLAQQPNLEGSRLEPWPAKLSYPDWEFRKLVFSVPHRKGASGEGRLMYLLNVERCIIQLVWLYTHENFEKRPADKDLKILMRELLDNSEEI